VNLPLWLTPVMGESIANLPVQSHQVVLSHATALLVGLADGCGVPVVTCGRVGFWIRKMQLETPRNYEVNIYDFHAYHPEYCSF
jgi:hypothetical protein